ncbi:MAG: hypothetical protein JJ916_00350 [Phycisphaerales bacterium]|nr:hypothetical protein [Phycisphaerales bacterium]
MNTDIAREVRDCAVQKDCDLGHLLRLCKILASELDSKPFGEWLVHESEGYPRDIELPDYRKLPFQLKGHFSGAFGSSLRHAPIPLRCIPEEHRHIFDFYSCRMSVSALQAVVNDPQNDGSVSISNNELAIFFSTNVYKNMNCLQCWMEISTTSLGECLNTVQNKILDIVLSLGITKPAAEDSSVPSKHVVSQVFNTTVYGGSLGSIGNAENISIDQSIVVQGDPDSLRQLLQQVGLANPDIEELFEALKSDPVPQSPGCFGPRVADWLGKGLSKAATGSLKIGANVVGGVLTAAINSYYGI